METTFEETAEQARAAARRLKNDLDEGLKGVKSAANEEMQNLIADVEELLARVAHMKDADVERVRGRVHETLKTAKRSLDEGAAELQRRARAAADGADDAVRDSPWVAVGIAALVGAVVGILVSRRS